MIYATISDCVVLLFACLCDLQRRKHERIIWFLFCLAEWRGHTKSNSNKKNTRAAVDGRSNTMKWKRSIANCSTYFASRHSSKCNWISRASDHRSWSALPTRYLPTKIEWWNVRDPAPNAVRAQRCDSSAKTDHLKYVFDCTRTQNEWARQSDTHRSQNNYVPKIHSLQSNVSSILVIVCFGDLALFSLMRAHDKHIRSAI